MTMVPWSLLAPEQTERIAAVLLGRKHPRAIRVRPSRGDGGIDLRDRSGDGNDDIYQIKSFATPLTDSRKRQIKESLDAVSDNAAVVIRDWYLVVPLNPSAAELDWFQNATASRPFAAYWFGLDRLESLAAEFPDVVDYYVGDGRRRVEQSIEQLRALAGIVPGGNSQLIAPADTTSPLAALYRTLNRDDPHFRYDFEVGAQPPPVQSLTDRRGLIGSFTYGEADVAVTHHVIVPGPSRSQIACSAAGFAGPPAPGNGAAPLAVNGEDQSPSCSTMGQLEMPGRMRPDALGHAQTGAAAEVRAGSAGAGTPRRPSFRPRESGVATRSRRA